MTAFNTVIPIAIIAIAGTAYIKSVVPDESLKIAKEILLKKKDLKEYSSIALVGSGNGVLENSVYVSDDNIKRVIVPSANYTNHDILLLSKYQQAVQRYFTTADPAITPICSALTADITLEECQKVSLINFEFFEYNAGDIAFTTSLKVGNKIKELEPNLRVATQTATTMSFVDKYPISKFSMEEISNKSLKKEILQKEIDTLTNVDIKAASRLNKRMVAVDPTKAYTNSDNIIQSANRTTTDAQVLKTIAEDSLFVVEKIKILDVQKLSEEPVINNIYADKITSINTFVDSHLSTTEKTAIQDIASTDKLEDSSTIFRSTRNLQPLTTTTYTNP
jgi:hypothetical protein